MDKEIQSLSSSITWILSSVRIIIDMDLKGVEGEESTLLRNTGTDD